MKMRLIVAAFLGAGMAACGSGGGSPTANGSGEDPLFADQWNLSNTGQKGATGVAAKVGEDINVTGAWATTKGEGVRIAIVDDGMEIAHEDLAANVGAGLSYNYASNGLAINDPSYLSSDTASGHGTSCAGIAAARDLNGKGGKGVSPRATLVGYNVLKNSTAANEADAMTRDVASISVSSNSWGATDGIGELSYPALSWTTAIDTGLATGRSGKGTIYVWAAGNGAASNALFSDNSNSDGQANYRGVVAAAAVNDQGVQSSYSESGANLWVSAPGGEFCDTHAITTVDRTGALGFNPTSGVSDYSNQNYTKCMNGTSSAAPTVAGVVALMLAANPNLGWRDVRTILAQTARKNNASDTGWATNGGTPAYHFNHKYGFGVVDATAAVAAAKTWTNGGAQLNYATSLKTPTVTAIPVYSASGSGISDTISVAGSGIASIEWVEITLTATNSMSYDGDLSVTLTNQSTGMISQLAVPHYCTSNSPSYTCNNAYTGWVFGSAAHLGEAADGTWQLTVKEGLPGGGTGTFVSWKLKFYGH